MSHAIIIEYAAYDQYNHLFSPLSLHKILIICSNGVLYSSNFFNNSILSISYSYRTCHEFKQNNYQIPFAIYSEIHSVLN
jgi:hypothetical protein